MSDNHSNRILTVDPVEIDSCCLDRYAIEETFDGTNMVIDKQGQWIFLPDLKDQLIAAIEKWNNQPGPYDEGITKEAKDFLIKEMGL